MMTGLIVCVGVLIGLFLMLHCFMCLFGLCIVMICKLFACVAL